MNNALGFQLHQVKQNLDSEARQGFVLPGLKGWQAK